VKKKVLFICVQKVRSQIAAALLNKMCGDQFEAGALGWNLAFSILWR
jgi:protein-tyrosine-phosphatase